MATFYHLKFLQSLKTQVEGERSGSSGCERVWFLTHLILNWLVLLMIRGGSVMSEASALATGPFISEADHRHGQAN